jgi:hypothetical protein
MLALLISAFMKWYWSSCAQYLRLCKWRL